MKYAVLAWVGTFLLFFSVAHGNLETTDTTATMHAARTLYLNGDSGLRTEAQGGDQLGELLLAKYIREQAQLPKPVHVYGKVGTNKLVYVWFPMGHVWLMVPAVAAGEALDRTFPTVEATFENRVGPHSQSYQYGHLVFTNAVVAAMPAMFGATSVLLLFLLACALGVSRRDAAWSTLTIAVGTQFFPLARESLSDGPGMCFLLGALLVTVRAHRGTAGAWMLLAGGFAAGFAVLTRYPHGMLVPFLALSILSSARRRGRWTDVLWFAAGGLPCLVLLLVVNYARFGDVTDTGYPKAGSWFNYPIYFGAIKILFAAGKGIAWFSPILWLAVPLAIARRGSLQLHWLAWVLFAVPMLMFSSTNGWQSGQCWGARYVTAGIVCLLAILLPQLRPWHSHRKLFALLLLVGVAVNITSLVAPTRGHNQLAGQAVNAMYQREYQAGEISKLDLDELDPADHFSFQPRFSGLHVNWHYAWRSYRGDFETEQEQPKHGSANTIEPLFGIPAVLPKQGFAPVHWEDRGGRHLWWVFWGELLGIRPLWLLLPVVLVGAVVFRIGWWGWLRQRRNPQQP